MRKMILLMLVVLCACARDGSYETLKQDSRGGRVKVLCAPTKLEVGLRASAHPIPFVQPSGEVTSELPFKSEVKIFDEEGALISTTSSEMIAVAWQAPDQFRHIEYFGLQEVELPSAIQCTDFIIELRHQPLPQWMVGGSSTAPAVYARKSRRP